MIGFALLLIGCSGKAQCPDDMVYLPGGEFTLGVDDPTRRWHARARTLTLPSTCMDRYEYPNRNGELPQVLVSWEEANSLCEVQGKRLCTSDEWERGCRGTERRTWSYGNTRNGQTCNTPIEDGPGSPPFPLAKAGSHPKCVSPEGVANLNGNVSEWVADPWSDHPEPFQPTARVDPKTWRTLRGGTMWAQTFYGQDCTSRHGHHMTAQHSDDGFRCCKSP